VSHSDITQTLIDAYRTTNFNVFGKPTFTLNIGEKSSEILNLFSREKCFSAAFITAWNPYSCQTPNHVNEIASAELETKLLDEKFILFDGEGIDPSGEWKGEPSFLALGISKETATEIGALFRQNAIVWIDSDCVPELLILR
jgi:hypothetical protein